MRVARITDIYDIYPIGGIEHVISTLQEIFNFTSDVNCIAVTYSFHPDVIAKLAQIAPNIRVFAGRATKPDRVRGAYVTPANTHFKGIMMWASNKVAYYIGSSNLTYETGGNYGIIVETTDYINFFDVNYNSVNEYRYGDPFFIIFNDIVFRETRGICEYTGRQFERLTLDNGMFRGVE